MKLLERFSAEISLFLKLVVTRFIGFCFWPLFLLFGPLFLIFRKFLDTFLRLQHGDKYGGLFELEDNMYMIKDKTKLNVLILFLIKNNTETDIYSFFKEKFEREVFCFPRPYPKMTSTHRLKYGYPYYIKDDLVLDDCFKHMSCEEGRKFDVDYLKEYSSAVYNLPFPKNDSALWDIYFSDRPLEGYFDDGYYYPVLFRFVHSMMDGTAACEFFARLLAPKGFETYSIKIFDKLTKKEVKKEARMDLILSKLRIMINNCALVLYIIFFGLGALLEYTYFRKKEKNALHSSNLSGQKIIEWKTENRAIVPQIKRIKKRIPNTKFSSILMSAITSVLTAHYERSDFPIPDNFSTLLTILLSLPKMDDSKPVPLRNKTAFTLYEIPTFKNNLLETLRNVEISEKRIKYADILTIRMYLKFAGIFPLPITKMLLGPLSYTLIISNTPGGNRVQLENGAIIDTVLVNVPNARDTGISLTVFTYDEKLQLGLTVDTSIISDRTEIRRILDDVFDYIDRFDLESRLQYGD